MKQLVDNVLFRAAHWHGWDFCRSFVVGDHAHGVVLAENADALTAPDRRNHPQISAARARSTAR